MIEKIISLLDQAGAEVFYVGGFVRDSIIGKDSKDIDLLVRLKTYEEITNILKDHGKVVPQNVGGKVSMLKFEDIDIAIPRTSEKKLGNSHTDFEISLDPFASVADDASRRDFTINAIAKNAVTGEVIDTYNGVLDLHTGMLRAVGDPYNRLLEDPLRIMRAIQFAYRFDLDIEKKTLESIRELSGELIHVSGERILMELEKAWNHIGDQKRLIELLSETEVINLFGEDFAPLPSRTDEKNELNVLSSFAYFFQHGGKYEFLKPSNKMKRMLELHDKFWNHDDELARKCPTWLKREEVQDFAFSVRRRAQNSIVRKMFWFEDLEDIPISGSELATDGHDLINLGIQGKDLGDTIDVILNAIYQDKIKNKKEDILEYVKEIMNWATHHIEKLQNGETVSFRPRGHSMKGIIESGQLVTCDPVTEETEINVGDAVLCKVAGRHYVHLVTATEKDKRYQISNNKGHINGWTNRDKIYGKVVRVES